MADDVDLWEHIRYDDTAKIAYILEICSDLTVLLEGERAVARERGEPRVRRGRRHGAWNADRHGRYVAKV